MATMSNGQNESNALVSNRSQGQLQMLLVGLMGEGLIRFKDSQPTEVEQKLYLVDWMAMVRDYGLEKFTRAVRLAYRKGSFFPKPGEIEKWIEPPHEQIKASYSPPTELELAFRGTEEQRQEWRKLKAKIEEVGNLPSRLTDTDAHIPTAAELAKELNTNPFLKLRGKP